MGFRSRSRFLILILCICVGSFASARSERPKNVQVALRAKWEGTPLLLEAGELISREGKDLFWDFIDNWFQKDQDGSSSSTAKSCIHKVVEHGRNLLSEHLASIFEVSLLLRSASPRLVLYRQLAGESLSSYPDEGILHTAGGNTESNEETERVDSLLVGVNPKSPGGKCCWVDTGGSLFFDVPELMQWLGTHDVERDSLPQPELFDFDHLYLESNASSPVAILYGSLGTDCFKEFHHTLVKAAKEGKVRYVVRPVLASGCEKSSSGCGVIGTRVPLNLGGYGVELALKNMEYKAMDDSMVKKSVNSEDAQLEDSEMQEHTTDLKSENIVADDLLASTVSDTLDIWELNDLGHQTAQKIVHSTDPLLSMQEISQNFPSIVSSLSRVKINNSVKEEILSNQRMVPPGKALMAINQALVNIEDIDLHMLIDLVRKELSLADQFSKLKIPDSSIQKLLSTTPTSDSSTFRIDFRSSHVHYLNNLEEDSMYKRWRSNVNEILMPAFPGQMRYIRKNLFHAVYIIDPASSRGLEVLEMIENFYENQLPIRFGVIFYSEAFNKHIENGANERQTSSNDEEDGSILIVRLFHYIKEEHGVHTAFKFLSNIRELQTESGDSGEDAPERHLVEKAFVETLVPKSKSLPQDLLLKLEKEKSFEDEAQKSSIFVSKLGFSKRGCTLLMNGLVFDANEEALINAMNEELPRIQEQVYYGNIASHTDVLEKFFSESGISRYNPQIVTDEKVKPKFVTLSESRSDTDFLLNDLSYLHSPETADDVKPVTHLLAVNVTSKKGINLLREGIHYLQGVSKGARLGVLFGPSNLDSDSAGLIFVKVFDIAASSHSYKKGVLNFMDQLCFLYEREFQQPSSFTGDAKKEFLEKAVELASMQNLPSEIYKSLLKEVSVVDVRNHLNKAALFLYRHLEADSNMNAVITNGRVIRITVETEFLSHDLDLLESLEFKRVKPILGIIEDVNWQDMDPDSLTSKFISDVVMLVSSSLASRERSTDSARFEVLHADYSAVILNHGNSSIHIDAVIDPLSPSGQKLASLFRLLSKYIQPSMRIILNPLSSLSDLPLKNYYRYVIPSVDDFSSTDSTVNGPKAFFANMPLSKTLTMNHDVPEPWLVEPVVAVHDLDNILLENLGETTTLEAVFELEALVLTGHCFEKDHEHPRGLQMILGTRSTPHLVDTLVMSNLGYWQMKASPGMWYLQLAPGRSSGLYVLKENDGTDGTALAKRIIISDLRGKVVHLEVMKKKNKEHEKLLITSDDDNHSETEQKSDNMWNKNILKWASGLIGGKQNRGLRERSSQVAKSGKQGKTVNIFSIASGHLYERFLKIMILSVLKNTERPVKFWFIKNYLSPQFKDVIPHMAKEYGFEYELITYKWPSWLHKQTEKQRIVWAYKILFLDVIFPLSLEKVIFVDADQVVRTDMGELYDLDIKGRPYAYTPFCDNNKEMDGYRFWRQGFWKEHLRGRPYHISALYVIDLVKFRRTAAGDTLRVFYENLSKDPNSLSNLDQDLPNYAQHVVPIFSLPQEWLWCESWCGNATKPKAKTIDLCNNPMTKEPKLQGARRIVTEWVDLDSEARGFTSKFLGEDSDVQVSSPSSIPTPLPSPSKDSSDETDLESRAEL